MKLDEEHCIICDKWIYQAKSNGKLRDSDGNVWKSRDVCPKCPRRGAHCKLFFNNCTQCGKSFSTNRKDKSFCSLPCYSKYRWKSGACDKYKPEPTVIKAICVVCSTEFTTHLHHKKTCSDECSNEYNKEYRRKRSKKT